MNNKLWVKFLDWLYKAHSITKDWIPDKTSIELWEEFRSSKIGEDTAGAI